MSRLPHPGLYPCDECPVRKDNCDNPRSKFPAGKWARPPSIDRRRDRR